MAPSARLIRLFASPIGSRAATTVFGRMPRTVGRARAALYTTGPTPPQTPSPGNSATTSGPNAGPGSGSGQGGPEPGSGSGPDSDSNSGTWSWFLGNQLGHPYRVLFSTIKYVALCHLLWVYVFTISPATGPSMFPTFDFLGDWIVISRLSRRGRDVRVGDIVCYDIPINNESGIKRVLGLPGDWVLLGSPGSYDGGKMIQVPQGHCWVVGDNLTASRDSRLFGPIPLALVTGKVIASIHPNGWVWNWDFRRIRNPLQPVEPNTDDE